jgi:putative phosphoesterase
MKTIAVFSDLHISSNSQFFPFEKINQYINDADMIFGLGDYVSQAGLDYLYSFEKEIFVVAGNMDHPGIKSRLSSVITLKVEDLNIGLIHGWGSPYKLREKILTSFNDVDLICYGHTHSSYFGKEVNTYFFNPGSLSGNDSSFGILHINKNNIESEIIKI